MSFKPPPCYFLRWVEIFSFDAGSGKCSTANFDFVNNLQIQTLVPIGCSLVLLLMYLRSLASKMLCLKSDDTAVTPKKEEKLYRQYLALFVYLAYLVLPAVATTIFAAYPTLDANPDKVSLPYATEFLTAGELMEFNVFILLTHSSL